MIPELMFQVVIGDRVRVAEAGGDAHVIEEIKDGVPLRIIPDALGSRYIGHPERHVPKDRH